MNYNNNNNNNNNTLARGLRPERRYAPLARGFNMKYEIYKWFLLILLFFNRTYTDFSTKLTKC